MNLTDVKVGDELFVVNHGRRGTKTIVLVPFTVARVGKSWVDTRSEKGGSLTFQKATGLEHHYSGIEAFSSREQFEHVMQRRKAEAECRRLVRNNWRLDKGLQRLDDAELATLTTLLAKVDPHG